MSRLIAVVVGFVGFAFAAHAFAGTVALRGTVVTPAAVIPEGYVVVSGMKIESVGTTAPRSQVKVINTDGIIFPGLIDLHNHVTWNAQPRWTPRVPVANRYEWILDPDFVSRVSNPQYAVRKTAACEENEYGELRSLIAGTTSIAGGLGRSKAGEPSPPCIAGLVRNLEEIAGLGPGLRTTLDYPIFPFDLPPAKSLHLLEQLKKGKTRAVFHVSEGVDASARREFLSLQRQGFLIDGVALIHGVALTPADFKLMKENNVALIWSPRTNIELYGRTADVTAARAAGVRIALAPDWAISGSSSLLEELHYASAWSTKAGSTIPARELFDMATSVPARIAGLDKVLGTIEVGKLADLVVLRRSDATSDPFETLVGSRPQDVQLVMIAGKVVLRDGSMEQGETSVSQEAVDVCGRRKWIDFGANNSKAMPGYSSVVNKLSTAFAAAGTSLAPLTDCSN